METTLIYCGYIGIMEKKMETTLIYWGYIGIMEKKMETTGIGNFGCFKFQSSAQEFRRRLAGLLEPRYALL